MKLHHRAFAAGLALVVTVTGVYYATAQFPGGGGGGGGGDASAANQTNGSQKTQIVDGSGSVIASTSNNLNVQCANCSGSGVSTGDNASFTAGASLFAGSGGAYQTTTTSNPLTAGHQGFAQMTQYRALMTDWYNSSGTEMGTGSDPIRIDPTGTTTQPVSGTVTANAGTNLNTSLLALEGGGNLATLVARTPALGQGAMAASSPVVIASNQSAVPASQSGTWTVQPGNTANTTAWKVDGSAVTQPVSAASLPLPTGAATSALQTTGNTALTTINTTLGSPFQAGGSVGISGTLPAFASTPTVNLGTLNGAATAANQPSNAAIASTTSGQTGNLHMGAVTTSAPTYTTGQSDPLSLTTSGALRVDGSTSTQPVSGTVTANAGTGTFTVSGTVTANAGASLNTSALALETGGNLASVKTDTDNLNLALASTTSGQKGNLNLGAVTTASPSYTNLQTNALSLTTAGALRVDGSAVTQPISAASLPLPTGAALDSSLVTLNTTASGSIPAGSAIIGALVANQSVNTAQVNGSTTPVGAGVASTAGVQRVVAAQDTTTIAGSAPGIAGTASANVVSVQGIASGTNLNTTVASCSTCNANGQATMANSTPVVLASNQSVGDPCAFQAKSNAAFSSASGTFSIVAGVSAKKIYVCSMILVAPSAVSVSLAEGSSSTCGTSNQAAVIGVATSGTAANGLALAANAGWTLGNGGATVAQTATAADYLCVFQSSTAQIAGNVSYVQQ